MSESLNRRIERYEIRERIGSGGMARVYKAWDTKLERLVAIKLLHEHLADDPTFKTRFEREAKVVASFDHPNIVHLFDYNVVDRLGDPLCYMVMSYIPGKTLRQEIEEVQASGGAFPLPRILRLVDHLTDALDYAHTRGMAHRDVKPGNILINESGAAILTDFGIARLVMTTRLTEEGSATGTPAYMSPEQAAGEAGDTRSDLYSLGVIVFELFAGHVPYRDDNSLAVMMQHLNGAIPSLSSVTGRPNPKLDLFIEKALAKQPDKRFQSAHDFQSAFQRVFRDDIPTAELFNTASAQVPQPSQVATPPPPAIVTAILPQPTKAPALTQQASIIRTLSDRVRANPGASTGFFILSAALVLVLILTAVLSSQLTSVPTVPTEVLADSRPFRSRFDGRDASDDLWPQTLQGDFTTVIRDGVYHLASTTPNSASTAIFGGGSAYRNVLIAMEGAIAPNSMPNTALGIVFRYQDDSNFHALTVDTKQRYSIWRMQDGVWTELRCDCTEGDQRWTESDAVRPQGESNRLSIQIIGSKLTAFINERKVAEIEDATWQIGAVGVYLGTPPEGAADADIDLFTLSESVPSMTGE